ncbi:C2TA protein, partial [Scytalopus superciliaris]|nr:C2TA protein [Scytalopus superciliaris]
VPENGYLELLHSDFDPSYLCAFLDPKPPGGGEGDFAMDLEADASNYEQLNNMDFLCTTENCENGDGLNFSSNTTDIYAKMAELVEYVLKDQQEKQVEDIFAGNLNLDEMAAENTEKFPEIKKQKCHKRSSAESCSDVSEPKYRKIVEVSAGNGNFLALPFNSLPVSCTSLTNQHMPFSVPAAHGLERSFLIPGRYISAMGVHLHTVWFI